jgi:hypothetical protein
LKLPFEHKFAHHCNTYLIQNLTYKPFYYYHSKY